MLRGALLLLAGMFHATHCWDASNIWFPDTNNPVFYNMTFYQQAAQTVVDNADNLIPPAAAAASERPPPPQRQRPAVFNRLPEETPPTPPTKTSRRPVVVQRVTKPVQRNRQPSQSDLDRLVAQQEAFIRNEKNGQRFVAATPVRESNPAPPRQRRPQSAIDRLADEQRTFIRHEQNGERYTVSPQASGNRRHSVDDRHDVFVRHEQRRPDFYPDVAVGYKTVPLEETTSAGSTQTYRADNNNNRVGGTAASRQQPTGNRLRRTKNEGIADGGGNYFNDGRFSGDEERGRWNHQARPESTAAAYQRSYTTRPLQRAVAPDEENRRRWNSDGTTGNGGDRTYRVEDNVIAGRESPSRPAGPSKCVWAIVSCCKPTSPEIRYTCFETLGCHGAFWDTNPCSKEMTMAAVQATADFYNIPRSSVD